MIRPVISDMKVLEMSTECVPSVSVHWRVEHAGLGMSVNQQPTNKGNVMSLVRSLFLCEVPTVRSTAESQRNY